MNANDTDTKSYSDDIVRTAEEIAARWSDEDPRVAHAKRGGQVPHREKRFYGSIGNP
jgi:hypothetical protein